MTFVRLQPRATPKTCSNQGEPEALFTQVWHNITAAKTPLFNAFVYLHSTTQQFSRPCLAAADIVLYSEGKELQTVSTVCKHFLVLAAGNCFWLHSWLLVAHAQNVKALAAFQFDAPPHYA